jgi:hypothetical protein
MDNELVQTLGFGGETTVHPVGLVVLLLACTVILFLNKKYTVVTVLVLIFLIPSAQRIVILSLDFSFLRIVIIVALIRAWLGHFNSGLGAAKADVFINLWMLWTILAAGFMAMNINSAISRTGFMVDAVGAYYVGRLYIKSWSDIERIIYFIGYASLPVLFLFMIERSTGRNIFSVFGGISEFTLVREGRLRCQGPFTHPIMAGLFWASILPWLAALWFRQEGSRTIILIIITAIIVIIFNTASSTPIFAIILCLVGLLLFPYRRFLPAFRWIALFFLVAAQLLMEKGAIHLLSRVDIVGGSTGWHRYHLMDQAIKRIDEWWVIGTKTTAHWGVGLIDVTNQYVFEGVNGGILGVVLFISFIYALFKALGIALDMSRNNKDRWIYWAAGVALFIHTFTFLSASYFGTMVASFFLFCGATASISSNRHLVP